MRRKNFRILAGGSVFIVFALIIAFFAESWISNNLLGVGAQIYDRDCASCHGADGKGNGPETYRLTIKPRDFTTGVYKFKSTPIGSLPTDEDLSATMKLGVRRTSMLPQLHLSEHEVQAVIEHIKTLSDRFGKEVRGEVILVPKLPERTRELTEVGRDIYMVGCFACHGAEGRGNGPAAETLLDEKGDLIELLDLTVRPLKRANTPESLYRIILSGFDGTPMPSYEDAFTADEVWALVWFLESIITERQGFADDRRGMMGRMGMGRMRGMFVGEEFIGMRIDMKAARAWMMSEMRGR